MSPPDISDIARRWLRWADEDLALAPADLDEATHADGLKAVAIARQVLDVVRSTFSDEVPEA